MVFLFINDGMVLGPGRRLPTSRSEPQTLAALGKRSVLEGEGGEPKVKKQGLGDALGMASREERLVRDVLVDRQVKAGGPLGKEESEIFVALESAEKILAKPQDKTTGIERVRARHTVLEAGVAALGLLNEALKAGEGEEALVTEPVESIQSGLQAASKGLTQEAQKNLISVLGRMGTMVEGIVEDVSSRGVLDGTQLSAKKGQVEGIRLWAQRLEEANKDIEEALLLIQKGIVTEKNKLIFVRQMAKAILAEIGKQPEQDQNKDNKAVMEDWARWADKALGHLEEGNALSATDKADLDKFLGLFNKEQMDFGKAFMQLGMERAVEAMQGVVKQIEREDATGGAANRKNIGRMLIVAALLLIIAAAVAALLIHSWPILTAAAAVILLVGGIYGVYTMVTRRESAEWQGGLDAIKARLELLQGAITGTLRVEADKPLPPHIMRVNKEEPKPPMLSE